MNDRIELGAYYSRLYQNDPPPGSAPSTTHQNDWVVSGRYDLNDNLLFKLEVHFINGTASIFNVPGISNPPGELQDSMTLFAAKTTYTF